MKTSLRLFAVALSMLVPLAGAAPVEIQQLLDAASPGTEVMVPAGDYSGNFTVPDGVTLMGEGADTTVLDGGGLGQVITMGKNAVIAGFTIRNGLIGISNSNECFFTVADCRITANIQYGVLVRGGSALIVSNLISGTKQLAGIACLQSNPYVLDNVLEGNPSGIMVSGRMVPTIVDNTFIGNQVAIRLNSASAITLNNVFDRNGDTIMGGKMDPTDKIQTVDLSQLTPYNRKPARYADLIKRVFDQVTSEHPVALYTLLPEDGKFLISTLFPWATFTVASATPDTKIQDHLAFDTMTSDVLASERTTTMQLPAVSVRSPQHPDMELNRYVLDMAYEHPGSYYTDWEGKRHFKRMTSFSIIRITLPTGWRATSISPEGTAKLIGDKEVVNIRNCGRTTVDLVLEKSE